MQEPGKKKNKLRIKDRAEDVEVVSVRLVDNPRREWRDNLRLFFITLGATVLGGLFLHML